MEIAFEKWHGCRNDFAVIWIADSDGDVVLQSLKRKAPALCDRRAGIGADGLLVLTTAKRGDLTPYRLTIVNSDGSIAQNCGNGLRCAALSVLKAHRERGNPSEAPEVVTFEVEGRELTCRFLNPSTASPMVAVEMGVPRLGEALPWHAEAVKAVGRVGRELGYEWLGGDVQAVDLGNPHLVIQGENVSREAMLRVGPALQTAAGLDGVNVHLIREGKLTDKDAARAGKELGQTVSELYQAYVWERGAGETEACGSGACAVVASAVHTGLVERSQWVAVDMPGGRLYVKHEEDGEPIVLAGPGAFVYSGRFSL